jgi:hypothetical protein
MPRTEIFLRTRDIDWAVKIGSIYIHASSAGDDLPIIVDNNLTKIWDVLKSSEVIYAADDVQLNDEYLNQRFPQEQTVDNEELRLRREWYIHSFRAMAMRGYYSFDRDIRTPIGESTYYLIAFPGTGGRDLHLDLPCVGSNITINELNGCNLVQLINRLSRAEEQK